jgi:hypothetical protein
MELSGGGFELRPASKIVRLPPSDYGEDDWAAIEAELKELPNFRAWSAAYLQPFPSWRPRRKAPDAARFEVREWFLFAAADYRRRRLRPPASLLERMRRCMAAWKKIDELEDSIFGVIDACFGADEGPQGAIEDFDEEFEYLNLLRLSVAACGVHLGEDHPAILPYTPAAPARIAYYRDVLSLWERFGGHLSFTNDPVTHEVTGTLVRYFFAVVGPVMGDDQPSTLSFPDIIVSYQAWRNRWETVAEIAGSALC